MPADFLFSVGKYPGPQFARNHLRAKADAQDGLSRLDCRAYKLLFPDEPRVVGFVIHAHGTAHDYQQVDVLGVRQFLRRKEARAGELVAIRLQPGFDATQPFGWIVLKIVCAHFLPLVGGRRLCENGQW